MPSCSAVLLQFRLGKILCKQQSIVCQQSRATVCQQSRESFQTFWVIVLIQLVIQEQEMNCDQPELFIMVWTFCLWFHTTRLALAGFSSRDYNLTFRLWYLLTVSCKSDWISLVSPQILHCCNALFPTSQSLLLLLAQISTPPPISIAYCGHSLPAGLAFVPELKLKKKSTGIHTKHFQISSAPDCFWPYLIPLCLCHGALQTLTAQDS